MDDPISELRRRYEEERHFLDDRGAAEYAYALAIRLREAGQLAEARRYARECLRLAETLPSATLDDVTVSRTTVGGVPMPEHFHDGVVRARLSDLLSD
ncbi:MAG TPA: tetratricopeptide repeat protein [Kribbellaceae bacterium]|nr:tetratricopeptide repeat protein [Kribbellaceae bacterium]